MLKIIKRTLLVIIALISLGVGFFIAYENSEKFATTIVSLECTLTKANSEEFRQNAIRWWGVKSFARLKNDWMRGDVLLYWLEDEAGESESGLQSMKRMTTSVKSYNSVNYLSSDNYVHRSFDRNTLVYRRENRSQRDYYSGSLKNWIERQCKIITNQTFDKLRDNSAAATKAMQKI